MSEVGRLEISHPVPFQVIQRHGYDPSDAFPNHPGGPVLGAAWVRISGKLPRHAREIEELISNKGLSFEARTRAVGHQYGQQTEWTKIDETVSISATGEFEAAYHVVAGGWYQLEVRVIGSGREVLHGTVVPVGVGEVYIIAGQSYAGNAHDAIFMIEDDDGRVSAYDLEGEMWRIAHDPQPQIRERLNSEILAAVAKAVPSEDAETFRLYSGGSFWPVAMNLLLPIVQVPIGMVNVAVGGTSLRQWMPGKQLYQNLEDATKSMGDFRAVLWQQGESDAVSGTDRKTYIEGLRFIRASLQKSCGHNRDWILAKSTQHPTAFCDPEGEHEIRRAIESLWSLDGFYPGPDTDILAGVGINRSDTRHSRHFTRTGQERAGAMWFAALWSHLNARRNL